MPVSIASMIPSGTSRPSASRIAGFVIRCPTLRTSISERHLTGNGRAIRSRIGEVAVELALHGFAALLERRLQVALHQAEPVAVGERLVRGVDGSDRILEVHDRGQRRLEVDARDARPVGPADIRLGVDQDLDAEAVVDEKHVAPAVFAFGVAGIFLRLLQRHGTASRRQPEFGAGLDVGDVRPRAGGERHRLVEERPRPGDHRGAAHRVVGAAARRPSVSGIASVP